MCKNVLEDATSLSVLEQSLMNNVVSTQPLLSPLYCRCYGSCLCSAPQWTVSQCKCIFSRTLSLLLKSILSPFSYFSLGRGCCCCFLHNSIIAGRVLVTGPPWASLLVCHQNLLPYVINKKPRAEKIRLVGSVDWCEIVEDLTCQADLDVVNFVSRVWQGRNHVRGSPIRQPALRRWGASGGIGDGICSKQLLKFRQE